MKKFQNPKGTRDILYEEAAIRRTVIDRLRRIFLQFGFCDFDSPSFELLETLERKAGPNVENQIYSFDDKGGRKLGLIFEFTASLGRCVASRADVLYPFKRYQIGKVWRYERPQSNRYREFYQADIDIIGPYTMDCEMEIFSLIAYVLRDFGLNDFTFLLNNRKILKAQLQLSEITDENSQSTVLRGIDKVDKISQDQVKQYILSQGISSDQYNRFLSLMPSTNKSKEETFAELEFRLSNSKLGCEGIKELRQILSLASKCGLTEHIQIAPFLVRGLDYYTGPIFEVRSSALNDVSFGGGGRYDKMVELFGGESSGAIGFAFGVERLISILSDQKLVSANKCTAQLMIGIQNSDGIAFAFNLANELRALGISVFQYIGTVNLRKQLSFASKMGIPFVIIIGEDEMKSEIYRLKNMSSGKNTDVSRSEISNQLKEELQRDVSLSPKYSYEA